MALSESPDTAAIVVVDDNPQNLRLLKSILSREGFEIHLIDNAEQAQTTICSVVPDLILMDIMMPDIDGFTLCRLLREHDTIKDIPIIFISALSDIKDKLEAFTAGGVDYVTKPFNPHEVLARVNTHLKLRTMQKELQKKISSLNKKS